MQRFIGVLAVGLAMAGCQAGQPASGAAAPGWHPVSAPQERLPWGFPLWAAGELFFFDQADGASLGYVPQEDRWRTVAPPPATDSATGWAMVSTGSEIVAVSLAAAAVYDPRADAWRALPPPPSPTLILDPQQWTPSLVWTGREVVLARPYDDDFAALDVRRGRWRSLPRTGLEGAPSRGLLLPTTEGLVRIENSLGPVPSVYLLRPGADQWRRLPDLPSGMNRIYAAGSSLFAGGLRTGSNDHERGRYRLPEGTWEPLPPARVWTAGGATVADGGTVALWFGSNTDRPERPNGVLLRPASKEWEIVPPPPQPLRGGHLLPAGDDFVLYESRPERAGGPRLLARYRPPSSPDPGLRPAPLSAPDRVCRAAAMTATRGENEFTRGQRYTVRLTNQSTETCRLRGPIELTASDDGNLPLTFSTRRWATEGPAVTALPDVDTAANMTIWMHSSGGTGPSRPLPECAGTPLASHLFVSWPDSEGTVEIVAPDVPGRPRLCNVEVSPFIDPWPSW